MLGMQISPTMLLVIFSSITWASILISMVYPMIKASLLRYVKHVLALYCFHTRDFIIEHKVNKRKRTQSKELMAYFHLHR